ncbi:dethiobiotin synthase, partial [Leptospira borgpetersenii serovar Balcanica]|nr:dethiobiotin synthase [Leptospira borgpetersenii serovar Balcanica]
QEYLATLEPLLPAPMLGEIPWLGAEPVVTPAAQWIDLSKLAR